MRIDEYTAEKDDDFEYGEQYWIYKGGVLKGWMCFFCGILRVAYCEDREEFGSPFLFHDLFGETSGDEFSTGKERRAALKKAITLLEEHYGDKRDPLRTVATVFPGAVVEPQVDQLTIF